MCFMTASVKGKPAPARLSITDIRSRSADLMLTMNQRAFVVPRYRVVLELAAAIIGAGCFALSMASAAGFVTVSLGIWLVPTGCALGAALLTFAITSTLLLQSELSRERGWRSIVMRWNDLVSDLEKLYIPSRTRIGHPVHHS
nr:hypothetical protein [Chlamydia buteonis]